MTKISVGVNKLPKISEGSYQCGKFVLYTRYLGISCNFDAFYIFYTIKFSKSRPRNFQAFQSGGSIVNKFVSHGGYLWRAILMLSIYLLLNFQNLRRAISKLSSQVVMEPRQQVFPRVLRKIVNFRGGSTKIAYFQGDVPENVYKITCI